MVTSREPGIHECSALDMLKSRLERRSSLDISVISEGEEDIDDQIDQADLALVMGIPDRHRLLDTLIHDLDMDLPRIPGPGDMHPEGFSLRTGELEGNLFAVLPGVDGMGIVYGIGALLRAINYLPGEVEVDNLDLVEQPAFRVRGGGSTAVGPGSRAKERGNMRSQTEEEKRRGLEDLILLGGNVFRGQDPARDLGLAKFSGSAINSLGEDFPEVWAATPSNSLHIKVCKYYYDRFICPSVPEAREALLSQYEARFREEDPGEYYSMSSGDVAGCTCEKCMPWGATFVRLAHDIADILHRYHPGTKVILTMQNLTAEGGRAVLDYVKGEDNQWFHGIRYSPGGNEMTTYNRGDINPRWFKYQGFGKTSNYLKHVHHALPGDKPVYLFSDITHWIRSQYGVERPDVSLAVIYNRRAWNARPRRYHEIARDVFHYGIGEVFYSEGMHDDFNKWLWYRMLWDPHLSFEEITREYCRYWFGPEAAETMSRVIFLMESTLERPVLGNGAIAEAVDLLRKARAKIPENLMQNDYRWRIITQKALLDRYIQLKLERGEELKRKASRALEDPDNGPQKSLREALSILGESLRTPEMEGIMEEVAELGEESNSMIGYREPSYFDLDEFDITEIGWWKEVLSEAVSSGDEGRMRNAAMMVVNYDDPGKGGLHEELGWLDEPENLVRRETILGYFPFKGPARRSNFSLAYSWRKPDCKLAFRYPDLEAGARYVVRICTGFHCDDLEGLMPKECPQVLEVNGEIVGEEFPFTLGRIGLYEFEIPSSLTEGGEMELVIRSASHDFPVVGASEIWVMKKEEMTWTVED